MSAFLLSLLAQGAGALLLVAVFAALFAGLRRGPHLYWAAAWLCFGLWLLLGALGLWWHAVFPGRTGWEHGLLYAALVCAWWHPALWASGAALYRRGRFSSGAPPLALAAATAAALASGLLLPWPWRNAALAAATAAAYAGSAFVFGRTWRQRRHAGERLVELHGGAVEAHSAGAGRGSEFVVRLPRRPPPPPASSAVRPWAAAPARRVLVVDDNADAALMLALLLRARGHDVRTAHSGPAALEEAVVFRPEAVVLDIGLPGMDGYEVARRLRQLPEHRAALLVALTGYAQ